MTKITSSLFLAALFALCLHVASAQAQYVRTCVSANGNDANSCHCSTPCRTFQRAHDQTLTDGELTVLDAGGYGPVTITKSISIVNDGVGEASIQVSGGTVGITVNAPAAGYVNLRGLTIQGVGFGGGTGLRFNTGFSLTITNCVVRNHTGDGIRFTPFASSNLAVSNTLIADNGGNGILVNPAGSGTGPVKVALSRVEMYNNSRDGFAVEGTNNRDATKATVVESVAAGNGRNGFLARTTSGTLNQEYSLMLVRSVAVNNATGIAADAVAVATTSLRVGQSTVTGNTASWSVSGNAILRSYGNNRINGNGDGDPAPPTIAKK